MANVVCAGLECQNQYGDLASYKWAKALFGHIQHLGGASGVDLSPRVQKGCGDALAAREAAQSRDVFGKAAPTVAAAGLDVGQNPRPDSLAVDDRAQSLVQVQPIKYDFSVGAGG